VCTKLREAIEASGGSSRGRIPKPEGASGKSRKQKEGGLKPETIQAAAGDAVTL
jgi:hypothetical protein